MLRTSTPLSAVSHHKTDVAVKRDLIHAFLHQTVHPAGPLMVHLPGFLILLREAVRWSSECLCAPLLCWHHAISLCHCSPLLPNNCCLLFCASVSIAAFFASSPLKNCSSSVWKRDFSEVKTCLVVNLCHGITLRCPLHEGDSLPCPTLYHLLLLSLCQVSAEQIRVRAFQPNDGKALSCSSKQLKQFIWKSPPPYPKDANPHQKLVQRRRKQFGKFHVKWQDDDNSQKWEVLCNFKIGWN